MGFGGSCENTSLRAQSQQNFYRGISTGEIPPILTLEQQPAGSTLLAHKLLLLWDSPVPAPEISQAWQQFPNPSHAAAGLRDAVRWEARKHLQVALPMIVVITVELLSLEINYRSIGCGKLCEMEWDMYRLLQTLDLHLNASLPALVVFQLIPAPGSSSSVAISSLTL